MSLIALADRAREIEAAGGEEPTRTEVRAAGRQHGSLVAAMEALFRDRLAAGIVVDAQELAEATGADRSHARRVHRRLVASLPAICTPANLGT